MHCSSSPLFHPTVRVARSYSIGAAAIIATSTHVPAHPISAYNLGQYAMNAVNLTHDLTGWNYVASIVAVTVVCRTALFPLIVQGQRVTVKREKVDADLKRFLQTNPSNSDLRAKKNALNNQYGYHPWQSLTLPFTNLGLTVYLWYGLRWMGYYYPTELSTGGILWFVDLTQPDPLYLLPIMSGTSCLLMFELGADFQSETMSPRRKLFGRGVALMLIPVLATAPASVHCFWTANWLMSAGQDVFVSQPAVREKLGIMTISERDQPIVFVKDVAQKEKRTMREEKVVETVVINHKVKKGPKNKKKKSPRR